jgi:uncharacterized protein (TIGR03435 family)
MHMQQTSIPRSRLRRASIPALIGVLFSMSLNAFATQDTTTGESRFSVASIRESEGSDRAMSFRIIPQGGRFSATNVPLRLLILHAFSIGVGELKAGYPGWIDSERFAIEATAERSATPEEIRRMIRALLEDRFGLIVSSEPKRTSVYGLTLNRSDGMLGPRLYKSTLPCPKDEGPVERNKLERPSPAPELPSSSAPLTPCQLRTDRGSINGLSVTMQDFAAQLFAVLGIKVIDKTTLSGRYDLTLEWETVQDHVLINDQLSIAAANESSLAAALREQLGLRLRPDSGEGRVYVIERIARPSAN